MSSLLRSDRCITAEGFQFLLKDNYRQLWTFLTVYIKDAESRSSKVQIRLATLPSQNAAFPVCLI